MDSVYFIGGNNARFQRACELNTQITLALLDRDHGRPVDQGRINDMVADLHRAIADTAAQHSDQVTIFQLAREVVSAVSNDCQILGRNRAVLLEVLRRCWDLKQPH